MKKLLFWTATSAALVSFALTASATTTVAPQAPSVTVNAPTVAASYYDNDAQLCLDPADAVADEAPEAGSCCKVLVEGCGKKKKVCVSMGCGSDAKKHARKVFAKATGCKEAKTNAKGTAGCGGGGDCDIKG